MEFEKDEIKLKKIGDSRGFFVPSEFIKVFKLQNNMYKLKIKNNGEMLIFEKTGEQDEIED